jgi:antitoxin component YwqK of YwqJK toxin-antitoxin module
MEKRSFIIFGFLLFFVNVFFAQQNINLVDANGNRTGQWEKRYNNGKVRYRGQFINGKEVGHFFFYKEHSQSKPYLIKNFEATSNIADVQFFSNYGIVESEGKMIKKNRVGTWYYYASNGKTIILEETYKNGLLDGVVKIFYKDGILTEESYYKSGKRHGSSKRYTSEGKMISNIPYFKGKVHGKVFYYDNHGVIRETGHYDMEKRVGRWEFYIDGELAGVEEPNKKRDKPSYSLEEIQARKEAKNPKKIIPKRTFTLEEIQARKEERNPTEKEIPKKSYTLEEIQARKEARIPTEKIIEKKTFTLEEIQARKEAKNPTKEVIPKRTFTLEEIQARKEKKNPSKKVIEKKTYTLEEIQKRKAAKK